MLQLKNETNPENQPPVGENEEEDENAKVEEASLSECFVENMCEYLTNPSNVLNHIDLSGMGFN